MPARKHILFISSWYPNRNNPTHGIFNLYFALAAARYNKVSVLNVCSEVDLQAPLELIETNENSIVTVNAYYRKLNSTFPLISQIVKRFRVLRAFDKAYQQIVRAAGKPDLIQLNVVLPMGVGAFHLSKKHNIPYVINENWSGYCVEDGNYRGKMQQFYTRKIVKGARKIMPTSTYLMEAMLKHDLNGNYSVVPNVVDVSVFKPSERVPDSVTRLIHISSLNDREKNVSGLIRAFHKASLKQRELELVIVGEGIDKTSYEGLVRELALSSKVKFTGRLMSEELVSEINHADALVMFSNYETFCLVIIEAFACGKPVITSNAGAIKTYMQPDLGIMVNKGNEEELEEAMLKFVEIKSRFDHEAIRKFAVDNYSYETIGKTLSDIYHTVLLEQLED
ncbi:MAG: glycosyltransferase [bacterium]|nr:glycosyltransferase [bacterium]